MTVDHRRAAISFQSWRDALRAKDECFDDSVRLGSRFPVVDTEFAESTQLTAIDVAEPHARLSARRVATTVCLTKITSTQPDRNQRADVSQAWWCGSTRRSNQIASTAKRVQCRKSSRDQFFRRNANVMFGNHRRSDVEFVDRKPGGITENTFDTVPPWAERRNPGGSRSHRERKDQAGGKRPAQPGSITRGLSRSGSV